jgi:hypothetical protein
MRNQKHIFIKVINNKKLWHCLFLSFCALGLIFFLQNVSFAQNSDSILFKIIKTNFVNTTGSEHVLFIYESGRVDCGHSTQTPTKKSRLHKTIGCFQVSENKISQMIKIAEMADFLNALSSYRFFEGGKHFGSAATIVYYRQNTEKIILLGTLQTSENYLSPPKSLNEFLQEVQNIDEKMEFENELDKKLAENRK